MGDLVTGRVAETTGQAFNIPYDEGDGAGKFQFISEVLRWRSQTQPENQLFTLVDARVRGGGGREEGEGRGRKGSDREGGEREREGGREREEERGREREGGGGEVKVVGGRWERR